MKIVTRCSFLVIMLGMLTVQSAGPLLSAQAQDENELTVEEVQEFLGEMRQLTLDRDAAALAERIDPDAEVEITSEVGGEPLLVKANTLAGLFEEGFEGLENYELKFDIDTIVIDGAMATVTGTTFDQVSDSQLTTTTEVRWTNEIEKREEGLIITDWQSRVVGYSVRLIED